MQQLKNIYVGEVGTIQENDVELYQRVFLRYLN